MWGSKGPDSFDCSGFVTFVFGQFGINLEGSTYDQVKSPNLQDTNELHMGDILFNYDVGHVEIYIGDGKTIAAQNSNKGIAYGDTSWSPINYMKTAITPDYIDRLNSNSDMEEYRVLCYTDEQKQQIADIEQQLSEIN